MSMILTSTDAVEMITSAAGDIDVWASYVDRSSTPAFTPGNQAANPTTATTTTIVSAPAASTHRNVKEILVRNASATVTNDITIQLDKSATNYECFKITLLPGESFGYADGYGFFKHATTGRMDKKLRVTANVVNATTAFADVTGLTTAVESGKFYCFEAHLFHTNDAATTGSRFAINGPAMTAMRIAIIDTVTNSVSASAFTTGASTALDSSAAGATTTGSTTARLGILSGYINPSAAGTFAIRCQSEVAVANGVTVLAGSWLRIWETDN